VTIAVLPVNPFMTHLLVVGLLLDNGLIIKLTMGSD
jgi:hypothetical protein